MTLEDDTWTDLGESWSFQYVLEVGALSTAMSFPRASFPRPKAMVSRVESFRVVRRRVYAFIASWKANLFVVDFTGSIILILGLPWFQALQHFASHIWTCRVPNVDCAARLLSDCETPRNLSGTYTMVVVVVLKSRQNRASLLKYVHGVSPLCHGALNAH